VSGKDQELISYLNRIILHWYI